MSPNRPRNESTRTQAESQDRLAQIVASVRMTLDVSRARRDGLKRALDRAGAPRGTEFRTALTGSDVALIAEVKRRSPSQGAINETMDATGQARRYEAAGARVVSVVTEPRYFAGSLDDLRSVQQAVAIPTLRKDFIVDPVQLYEARLAGAAAVLLIVRALEETELASLNAHAQEIGLATLVEVHEARELEVAAALDPSPMAIGVNARDLSSFEIDLAVAEGLMGDVPASVVGVAESGITSRTDVERMAAAGADAVLVGTALAAADDPQAAARALVGVERRAR